MQKGIETYIDEYHCHSLEIEKELDLKGIDLLICRMQCN